MTNRILWINPGEPIGDLNREFQEILEKEKRTDTEVKVVSTGRGPRDLEYRYYEALVLADTLHRIKKAEKEGYDAAIIGCFYDPGLQEAKEVANIIVTAPAEASMHIAATLGHKFSIIIGRDKWIPQMMENAINYGLKNKVASFKSIGLRVSELRKDKKDTANRIREAAKEAVEQDLAEVIILGCTMEYGFFREIQKSIGVPIIDPLLAAFKYAELLIELNKRFHWRHSKIGGYEQPPKDQIINWNLEEQYGVKGFWD